MTSTSRSDGMGRVFWWSAMGGMLLAGGSGAMFVGAFIPMEAEVRGWFGILGVIAVSIGGGLLTPMLLASRLR